MPVASPKEAAIKRIVDRVVEFATLPDIARQVIALVQDPKSNNTDLERIIARDPVLCGKILKVANSAMYGHSKKIASLRRAIDLLGHAAVRNISVAAAMSKLLGAKELSPGTTTHTVWHHAHATAACSRWLVGYVAEPIDREEAYLAGLLHEIGTILLHQVDPRGLQTALQNATADRPLIQAEDEQFGANHQDIGAALCEAWRLPRAVSQSIAHHHAPLLAPAPARSLAGLTYIADILTAKLPGAYQADLVTDEPDPRILEAFGLSADLLPDLLEAVRYALEANTWDLT